MLTLRSIGVLSCAKIMGAVYGCLGLIFLPLFLIGGFASLVIGKGSEAMSGIAMLALAIIAPIFYGAMGFVMGAFTAWVYNIFAKWIGGVQLELRSEISSPLVTTQTPQQGV
jgi:hypothetical protein